MELTINDKKGPDYSNLDEGANDLDGLVGTETDAPKEEIAETEGSSLSVESLVEDFSPVSGLIDMPLPNGGVLQFSQPRSYGEAQEFKRARAKWIRNILVPANRNDAIKEAINTLEREPNIDDFTAAYTIHKTCVTPGYTLPEAIRLTRATWLVDYIMSMLNAKNLNIVNKAVSKEVEAALKGLRTDSTTQG